MLKEWNQGKWVFKDVYNFGYPYYHVHPYKQKAVKYIVDNFKFTADYLIIFGSSVQTWHKWWKDLDICVISASKNSVEAISSGLEIKNDILWYESLAVLTDVGDRKFGVRNQIIENGVMVHEKI